MSLLTSGCFTPIPDMSSWYISKYSAPPLPSRPPTPPQVHSWLLLAQSSAASSEKSALTTLAKVASEPVYHVGQFNFLLSWHHDPESFMCLLIYCLLPQLECKFHVGGDCEWAHNQFLHKHCSMNIWKNEWARKWIKQTPDQRVGMSSHKFWYRFIYQIFTEHLLCVRNCSRYWSNSTEQNSLHSHKFIF